MKLFLLALAALAAASTNALSSSGLSFKMANRATRHDSTNSKKMQRVLESKADAKARVAREAEEAEAEKQRRAEERELEEKKYRRRPWQVKREGHSVSADQGLLPEAIMGNIRPHMAGMTQVTDTLTKFFTTSKDGYGLANFHQKLRQAVRSRRRHANHDVLIVIKLGTGHKVGFYLARGFERWPGWSGNGQSFIFTFNTPNQPAEVYPHTGDWNGEGVFNVAPAKGDFNINAHNAVYLTACDHLSLTGVDQLHHWRGLSESSRLYRVFVDAEGRNNMQRVVEVEGYLFS